MNWIIGFLTRKGQYVFLNQLSCKIEMNSSNGYKQLKLWKENPTNIG